MPGLKLMATLGLDGSGFESGFHRARGVAVGLGAGLKNIIIGAVGITTVEEAMRRTVQTTIELGEASKRLAIAPEQLQVLRQAAKDSHVELSKLEEAFEKIDVAREKALIPGKEGQDARRAFGAIGIGMDALHHQTAAQLFTGPMRAAAMGMNPEQLGIVFRELGMKAFGELIPVLKTNFEEVEASLKKFGGLIDAETIAKFEGINIQLNLLSTIIAAQLGPAMIRLAEFIYGFVLSAGKALVGGAAFVGAATSDQGWWGGITSAISAMGHTIAKEVGWLSEEEYDKKIEELLPSKNFDVMEEAQKPWLDKQEQFAELLRRMTDEADKLRNPVRANFETGVLGLKLGKKELENPTDSLLRIGNFLGGSQSAISRLAERRTEYLRQLVIIGQKNLMSNIGQDKPFTAAYPHG